MNLIRINFRNFFKSLKDRTTEMVTLRTFQIIKTQLIITKHIANKKYNNYNMINRNKQQKDYCFRKNVRNAI